MRLEGFGRTAVFAATARRDGVQGNAGGNEVKLVLKVVGERRKG